MGRKYQRKNGDEPLTDAKVKSFVIVKQWSGLSFQKSAQRGITISSLHSISKKCDLTNPHFVHWKGVHCRQVFSKQQETEQAAYLIFAQKLNHGPTPVDTRKLAFMYASQWSKCLQVGKQKNKLGKISWPCSLNGTSSFQLESLSGQVKPGLLLLTIQLLQNYTTNC